MDKGLKNPDAQGHPGGCPCGQLRFRLTDEPMFVHACHCRNCQRETGGPFAHHALIERTRFEILSGEPQHLRVPSSSGTRHLVARCAHCGAVLWNEWGHSPASLFYVRVGSLDEPDRLPPQAHIFTRSRQPWVNLDGGSPAFKTWYDPAKLWPKESLGRRAAAKAPGTPHGAAKTAG